MQGQAGRPADEDALLTRQTSRGHERLLVADLHDLVDDVDVHRAGDEVFADALDLVRRDRPRVERSLGIRADDVHRRLALLQVFGHAGDGAAGSHARHEHVDAPLGLLPDLGTRRRVVRLRVARVEVLVRLERAGNLARQPVGHRVVRLRRLALHVRGAYHDLCPVRTQQADLLRRHLVRHHEDHLVALDRRHHREAVPGVARGRFDDGPPRPQLSAPLGVLDHRQADPVLDAASWVQLLELGQDGGPDTGGDLVQADQRGVPDEVENRF